MKGDVDISFDISTKKLYDKQKNGTRFNESWDKKGRYNIDA